MKKNLLVASMLFAGIQTQAQITINAGDVIEIQEYVERAYDYSPNIVHSPAGPNQTWNFGMLLNQDVTEMFGFSVASWYDGHEEFPDANFGTFDAENGFNVFGRKNNDAIDILGIYGDFLGDGSERAVAFNQYDRIIQFPAAYGDEYNNAYTAYLSLEDDDFDSIVVNFSVNKLIEIDAWGEITTPFGTFQTLRQHINETTSFTVTGYLSGFGIPFVDETSVEDRFEYWTNDPVSKFVVLEYTYDSDTDLVDDVIWQRSSPVLSLDEESAEVKVNVYPNPASEFITIDTDIHAVNYAIFDLMGKKVTAGEVDNNANKINVSGFNAGTYVLQLQDQNEKTVAVRRIVLK